MKVPSFDDSSWGKLALLWGLRRRHQQKRPGGTRRPAIPTHPRIPRRVPYDTPTPTPSVPHLATDNRRRSHATDRYYRRVTADRNAARRARVLVAETASVILCTALPSALTVRTCLDVHGVPLRLSRDSRRAGVAPVHWRRKPHQRQTVLVRSVSGCSRPDDRVHRCDGGSGVYGTVTAERGRLASSGGHDGPGTGRRADAPGDARAHPRHRSTIGHVPPATFGPVEQVVHTME